MLKNISAISLLTLVSILPSASTLADPPKPSEIRMGNKEDYQEDVAKLNKRILKAANATTSTPITILILNDVVDTKVVFDVLVRSTKPTVCEWAKSTHKKLSFTCDFNRSLDPDQLIATANEILEGATELLATTPGAPRAHLKSIDFVEALSDVIPGNRLLTNVHELELLQSIGYAPDPLAKTLWSKRGKPLSALSGRPALSTQAIDEWRAFYRAIQLMSEKDYQFVSPHRECKEGVDTQAPTYLPEDTVEESCTDRQSMVADSISDVIQGMVHAGYTWSGVKWER